VEMVLLMNMNTPREIAILALHMGGGRFVNVVRTVLGTHAIETGMCTQPRYCTMQARDRAKEVHMHDMTKGDSPVAVICRSPK
jgi:hypothetical protein